MSERKTEGDAPRATMCALPWTHLFVDPVGTLTTCCVGDPRPSPDAAGVTIRAGQRDAIRRHWFSPRMRGVRADLASGRRSEVCNHCWLVENSGGVSQRHRAADMYFEPYEESLDDPPPRIQFVDLRLGNFCNLNAVCAILNRRACCIPEYRELQQAGEDFWMMLRTFPGSTARRSGRICCSMLRTSAAFIWPVASRWSLPGPGTFLRQLRDLGFSRNIDLSYNSNWTVIPKWTAEIWRAFKSVDVFISMDGVGEANEFIRGPLKWDVFRENLALVEERHDEFNIRYASIHATAQVYNVMRPAGAMRFVRNLDFIDPYPHIAIAVHPEVFDPRVLPGDLKEKSASSD